MRFPRPRTLRGRLTVLFGLGSALLVLAVSLLIVAAQSRNSNEVITKNLRARIDRIVGGLRSGGKLPATELYAQVFTQFGTVRDLSSAIGTDEFLLDSEQRRFVFSSGSLQFDRDIPALGGRARLLAEAKDIDGTSVVVVVGSSLELEAQARNRLLRTLALVGPSLVALLSLGGWSVAGAALRPVRRMTNRASAITRADTGDRLPIPPNADEIAHLGRTLNAMLDRLEDSFRREQAFVDDASHELRTPLAILRGELELGLLHPGDAAEQRRMLAASIEEVDRLGRLADDLLVLARLGTARDQRADTPIDVFGWSSEVVDRLRPTLPSGLVCTVSGRATHAVIAPGDVERLLTNLVGNASRFATRSIDVEVAPVERASGWQAELCVRDDGPGFPPELLARVFERFVIADSARTRSARSGTGIGLAIVAALATRWGGTASASNRPSGGAEVTISLPLATVAPRVDKTPPPTTDTTGTMGTTGAREPGAVAGDVAQPAPAPVAIAARISSP